jgi:hypothetical protein
MLSIKQTFSSSSDGYDNLDDSHDNSVMSSNVLEDSYLVMLNNQSNTMSSSHTRNNQTLSLSHQSYKARLSMLKSNSSHPGCTTSIGGFLPTESAHTTIDKEITKSSIQTLTSKSKNEKDTVRRHFTAFLAFVMFIIGIVLIVVCVHLFRKHNVTTIVGNSSSSIPTGSTNDNIFPTNDTDVPTSSNITNDTTTTIDDPESNAILNTTTETKTIDLSLLFANVTNTISNESLTSFESVCSKYLDLRNNTLSPDLNGTTTETNGTNSDIHAVHVVYTNFSCIFKSQALHSEVNVTERQINNTLPEQKNSTLDIHMQVSAMVDATPLLQTKSSTNDTDNEMLPLSPLLIDWFNTTGDLLFLDMLRNNSNVSDVFNRSTSVIVSNILPTTTNVSNTSSINLPTTKPSTTVEMKPNVSSTNKTEGNTNTVSNQTNRSIKGCSIEQQSRIMLDIDLSIRFYTEAYSKTISCEVTYSGGEAWIGVSFTTSSSMIPAMAAIGLPGTTTTNTTENNVWRYVLLSKSINGVTRENVSQTLLNTSLIQNSTHTIMQFTKLLKDIDDGMVIPLSGTINMNYAIGCSNDLKSGHCAHGSVNFSDILPCNRSMTIETTTNTTSNQINATVSSPSEASIKTPVAAPVVSAIDKDESLLCNGHANYCDVPVNTVLFAGVHNAHVSIQDRFMLLPNQEFNIQGALSAGFRAINVDLGICDDVGTVSLVHGLCITGTSNASKAFEHVANFLIANPNEVIILPTQINNELKGGDVTNDSIDAIFKSIPKFKEMMYSHSPGKTNKTWPTMRELIQSNKRIIYMQYNSKSQCSNNSTNSTTSSGIKSSNKTTAQSVCPEGFHDWFHFAVENQFEYKSIDELKNSAYACEITRGDNRVTPDFVLYNVFTTIPSDTNAAITNTKEFLQNFISNCTTVNKLKPSVVLVDYWNLGDVLDVVQQYNANELGNSTNKAV